MVTIGPPVRIRSTGSGAGDVVAVVVTAAVVVVAAPVVLVAPPGVAVDVAVTGAPEFPPQATTRRALATPSLTGRLIGGDGTSGVDRDAEPSPSCALAASPTLLATTGEQALSDSSDTKAGLEAFLAVPRLGTLITRRRDGTPVGVPVWFEWTGTVVQMFASATSAKVRRLKENPAASLVVANHIGEHETWVSFDGTVTVSDTGGIELASRLAPRYWDLTDPRNRKELDSWLRAPEAFCLLTLTPDRVRTGS